MLLSETFVGLNLNSAGWELLMMYHCVKIIHIYQEKIGGEIMMHIQYLYDKINGFIDDTISLCQNNSDLPRKNWGWNNDADSITLWYNKWF